jgi:hypothetical protein
VQEKHRSGCPCQVEGKILHIHHMSHLDHQDLLQYFLHPRLHENLLCQKILGALGKHLGNSGSWMIVLEKFFNDIGRRRDSLRIT